MRPMLAASIENFDYIKYPIIVQPKLDGIRCLVTPSGEVLSRTLKPIPNRYIRDVLSVLGGFDGELIVEEKTYNEIQSDIMTESGMPNFIYVMFDRPWVNASYKYRYLEIPLVLIHCEKIISHTVSNRQELENQITKHLDSKYEGVILRNPDSPYKHGRSTLREGHLLKYKSFSDSEAKIVSCQPLQRNMNEPEIDNLGLQKRSSHLINQVIDNMLGSFEVIDVNKESPFFDKTFRIGSGFTEEQRIKYWLRRFEIINKIIVYKYQNFGYKDLPRSPVFKGFRYD